MSPRPTMNGAVEEPGPDPGLAKYDEAVISFPQGKADRPDDDRAGRMRVAEWSV